MIATILFDDGAQFAVDTGGEFTSADDACEFVWDLLHAGDAITGRWADENGVPQEQMRVCMFYERAIRCVMVNV